MEQIRQAQKKYCSLALILSIFIAFGLILTGLKPVGKGLILGTLFSIVNFIIMGETLPSRIVQSSRKVFAFSLGSIFFRYFLMAVPVIVALKYEEFNLPAVIVGLFMVQLMIIGTQIVEQLTISYRKRA